MTYIFEKLYLGDLDDACNSGDLRDKKCISHILTVDCKPLVLEAKEGFVYKYVHALDVEDFDILSHIDDCINFIDDGRKSGGILVHCYAGQSRSATVVVAYLMARQDLTMSDALQLVKKMRSCVGPNPGFLQQLELFEAMGNRVNANDFRYRQHRLNLLATHMMNFTLTEDNLVPCLSSDPSLAHTEEAVYKCMKCRRSLFRESGIVTHSVGFGHSSFKKHNKVKIVSAVEKQNMGGSCSESIFIEPVAWMQSMILSLKGKLSCPNCHGKIGSFTWSGEQCPCGQWVTPAFHLQKSKLDYCDMRLFIRKPLAFVAVPNATNCDTSNPAASEIEPCTNKPDSNRLSYETKELTENLNTDSI